MKEEKLDASSSKSYRGEGGLGKSRVLGTVKNEGERDFKIRTTESKILAKVSSLHLHKILAFPDERPEENSTMCTLQKERDLKKNKNYFQVWKFWKRYHHSGRRFADNS